MTSRTEITINPDGSQSTSSSSSTLIIQPGGGSSKSAVTTSASMSTAFSSSSSTQMSKSSSSSSNVTSKKTVKQTMTTSKTVKSSTIKTSSSSSKAISIKSSGTSFKDTFAKNFGVDVDAEMKKLMATADQEVQAIRNQFFKLQPLSLTGSSSDDIIKLDKTSIEDYIDKKNNDRVRFNFDVTEYESESISVKSDGNKLEVHAKKRSKKGDDETNEEYSRVYELPTTAALDSNKVTSSVFKDGVLTIELPVEDAIGSA